MLSGVGVRSTGARSDTVAESPGSPASRDAARSSSMGDLACRTGCGPSDARVAKPSPSVDVVGFFVDFGGGVLSSSGGVLSCGVELRSGAACLQAERRERLRCCPPTYFDVAFDASGVRLKLLFRSVP